MVFCGFQGVILTTSVLTEFRERGTCCLQTAWNDVRMFVPRAYHVLNRYWFHQYTLKRLKTFDWDLGLCMWKLDSWFDLKKVQRSKNDAFSKVNTFETVFERLLWAFSNENALVWVEQIIPVHKRALMICVWRRDNSNVNMYT